MGAGFEFKENLAFIQRNPKNYLLAFARPCCSSSSRPRSAWCSAAWASSHRLLGPLRDGVVVRAGGAPRLLPGPAGCRPRRRGPREDERPHELRPRAAPAAAPHRPAHPEGSPRPGGRARWTSCSWAADRPAWPAPSSWRAWSRRTRKQGGGLGDVEIAVLEKAETLGRALPLRAPSSTRSPSASCSPTLKDSELPLRAPVDAGARLPPHRPAARCASPRRPPCATTATTWPRSARSCAGWARRPRAWASTCSRASRPTRCWSRANAWSACARRPRGLKRDGPPGRRLHAAHRRHGQGHGARRGHARRADAGLAAVAGGRAPTTRRSTRSA